ncbi:MAG: Hsp20/alpha crystallin family protein [Scytolyngbya sp. HA4215-MV1]|jgi:HSP20 family protein|nr:Hsp20/alpha crystallin family protein [Scytolyngbya sp. HA4215-MV1]
MMIRYWQPFRQIETLRHQLDQVFDELTHTTNSQTEWMPAVELKDAGDHLVLKAQLPGMTAKDLDVQVMREAVALSGEHRYEQKSEEKGYFHSEFRYGKFQRVIPLPIAVQNDQVQADFKDGILTLTLPKVAEARNQVFKVNLADLNTAESTPTLEAKGESAKE